ncbi:hypothetical protein SAMN06265221_11164 [Paracoccus laeviglucosivorans]|uniref:Uncharacterized protein n=1 Tax=Paracoccus laeviglucosivorans TaxID=1197861 RepID=A0A521E5G1_9RHOB|nr:hypothetical protein SAMN06265221_11164 [Paracoccus laeviglucosivorans]
MQASEGQNSVLYVDRRGVAVESDRAERFAAETERLAEILAASAIPEECGFRIRPAPARGGFAIHRSIEITPVGTDGFEAVHRGAGGRSAIRAADVFDRMINSAQRRKQPWPLTPGQIAMGRRYAALVEFLASDGVKLSKLEASFGGGDGGNWMDRRLQLSDEVAGMRKRIGTGIAMAVRRVRPSERGDAHRGPILDRTLVDMVCLQGRSLEDVLKAHGWMKNARTHRGVTEALCGALDRMIGYRA